VSLTRTVYELERLRKETPDSRIAGLLHTDKELWTWCVDLSHREFHLRRQRETDAPKPPAPPSAIDHDERSCSRATALKISKAAVRASSKYARETFLQIDEANARADGANHRLRQLEERCMQLEKRVTTAEVRCEGQSRHLRNLESRLRGEKIERAPRLREAAS
jgi:hypothetical protein